MWIKLDDNWMSHPKIVKAGRDARDLWLASITWCAKYLTDGKVPGNALPILCSMAGISLANCQDFANTLLDVGLWDANGNDYEVHDYLEYNPSREQAEATAESRRQAGKRGGVAKAVAKAKQTAGKRPGKNVAKVCPVPVPVPVPVPEPEPTTDANASAAAVPQAPASKVRDANLDHPAVIAYREFHHITPSNVQRAEIAETVEDLARWEEVMKTWVMRGFKKFNVEGQLSWYKVGIPQYTNGKVREQVRPSDVGYRVPDGYEGLIEH